MINQRDIFNLRVNSVAELKAIESVQNGLIVYCNETQTLYEFISTGSEYTANDKDIVITNAGGNTKWVSIAGKYLKESELGLNGFENRTDTTLNWNGTERWLDIVDAGNGWSVWSNGKKFNFTGNKRFTWINETGAFLFYIDDNGDCLSTNIFSEDIYIKYCIVAAIYFNASTGNICGDVLDERHSYQLGGYNHFIMHFGIGAIYFFGLNQSGFIIDGDGSSDAHACFVSEGGIFYDEDKRVDVLPIAVDGNRHIFYLNGDPYNWESVDKTFPLYSSGGGGRPYYNLISGTSASLAQVDSNKYFLMHIVATTGYSNQYFYIMGQNQYVSISAAREAAQLEIVNLQTGALQFNEFVFIGTVIFQVSDTYTNSVKAVLRSVDIGVNFVDFRGQKIK